MIVWNFDCDMPKTNEISCITIPEYVGDDYDDSWVYRRFDVLIKFVCEDGYKFVVYSKPRKERP